MGALCGKKATKRPFDASNAIQGQTNNKNNVVNQAQQILNPPQKPKVYNPNLDKSQSSQINQSQQKPPPSQSNPNQKPKPSNNNSSVLSPEQRVEQPKNKKPQDVELQMSPNKSPTKQNPPQILKETEGLTPHLDDPKSLSKGPNSSVRHVEVLPLLEPERRNWFEGGEFVVEALLAEDDDFLWPREEVPQQAEPLIEDHKVREEEEHPKPPIGLIYGDRKKLLEWGAECSANYYEIDLFDVLQTFEPEEEEEESAKGKSDIHELNSSGIHYKEEEYGIPIVKPLQETPPKREFVMELNNEIIEEKREESELIGHYHDEKPSERPEPFPIDNVGLPENEGFDYQKYEDEFEKEFYNNNNNDQEDLEAYDDKARKKADPTAEALQFLEEEEEDQQSQEEEDQKGATGAVGIENYDFDKMNVEEQFFINKVELKDFDEEEEEKGEENSNENNYNIRYYESVNEEEKAGKEENEQAPNDFSYSDIITPAKDAVYNAPNNLITPAKVGSMRDFERISARPVSESMKKRLNWWSAKKN